MKSRVRLARRWKKTAPICGFAAIIATSSASADPPPLCDIGEWYGVAQGYNCADYQPHDPDNPEVPSMGWWGRGHHAAICLSPPSEELLGFPLNVDLVLGVAPPDLPPRTRSLPDGSSPLVPAMSVVPQRPVHRWERPVLAESVDLVTGIPLVQEIDLELPFGSATYRHVRTYSEMPAGVHENWCYDDWVQEYPEAYFWDWQGQGWMMGEAPLFLIDAAYDRAVWTDADSPRRCYFIPDAHHAIPFVFDETYGEYVAPPHFDAYLRHDGDGHFDELTDFWVWDHRPSVFRVSLHDGAINYTIRAIYGDVYPGYLTEEYSDHDTPDTPGLYGNSPGAPYWGVVERIDDAFGNTIDIEYCTFRQTDYDNATTGDCTECLQNTHEKGQINRVRLIAGTQLDRVDDWDESDWDWDATQSGEVAWTLLYAYRSFLSEENERDLNFPFHRQTALHELRVYEGERLPPSDCATIHFANFIEDDNDGYKGPSWNGLPTQLDAMEALTPTPALPDDWTHRLSYVYTEPDAQLGPDHDTELYRRLYEYSCPYPARSPRLMKATVAQRIELDDGSSQLHEEYTLYRYDAADASPDTGQTGRHNGEELVVLRDIYRHEQIADALAQLNEDPTLPPGQVWTVNHLVQGWGPGTWDIYEPAERPLDDALFEVKGIGGTGGLVNVPWTELSSLSLFHWGDTGFSTVFYRDARFGAWGTADGTDAIGFDHSPFAFAMFNGYVGTDVKRTGFVNKGVAVVAQRGEGGGQSRFYKLYRFMQATKELDSDATQFLGGAPSETPIPERALFREPYRLILDSDDVQNAATRAVPFEHALWITVIDEYATIAGCEVADSAQWSDAKVPLRRRVLFMGAAGFVQFEKEWRRVWDDASGAYILEPGESSGMREEYVYDKHGRLKEHRTFGWGTSENTLPNGEGLVRVFEYEAPLDLDGDGYFYGTGEKLPLEVIATGLKRGSTYEPGQPDTDTIWWLEAHERHPDKPELVTRRVRLREPVTDLAQADSTNADITECEYGFDTVNGAPEEWRIKRKTIRGPQVTIGGVAYRPTEIVWNDVGRDAQDEPIGGGQVEWRGYGLVSADGVVGGGEPHERFFFDYWRYDDKGRLIRAVFDAESGKALGNLVSNHTGQEVQRVPDPPTIPTYPDGLPRVAVAGPLSLMEKYHHGTWGPLIAEHTNGRQTIYSYSHSGEGEFVKRTYNGFDSADHQPHGPGSVEVFMGGTRLRFYDEAIWDYDPNAPLHEVLYDYIRRTALEYDAAGRPIEAQATGWDSKTVEASVAYDQFGGFMREKQPDGTLKRIYRDPLGRPERIFHGSNDQHVFFGYPETGPDEDMVLTEFLSYGEDTTNARKLIETRRFRERPVGQYDTDDFAGQGWVERRGYDWRMRETWVQSRDASGGVTNHRITLYDHQNRVRFVAEYGDAAPVPIETLGQAGNIAFGGETYDGLTLPSAAAILSTNPLRLSETIYNALGQVEEQRQYNVEQTSGAEYLTTRTWYDHQSRPIAMESPNAAATLTEYDAKGRAVVRRVVRDAFENPPYEIARTETVYDADDHAIVIKTWQRVHDGTGSALDTTNSVRTIVWNWYDYSGRLAATADLGTGDSTNDRYVTASFAEENYGPQPSDAPSVSAAGVVDRGPACPNWAVLTVYRYNSAGQKAMVATEIARDSATGVHEYRIDTYRYDGLGSLVFWTENDQTVPDDETRQTAYLYEEGRLVKMAAILPGHELLQLAGPAGGDPDSEPLGYYVPDWEATDGTLQVTRVEYDAEVWTGDGQAPSRNFSWVGRVYFPDLATGQPNAVADLTFTYYPDGLLRTRTDRRGHTFTHEYDELGRRIVTTVAYPAYDPNLDPIHRPKDLASRFEYTYDDLGALTKVTALGDDGSGGHYIVAENVYEYDARGNLRFEYQELGAAVDTTPQTGSARTEYAWSYSQASGGHNFDRLSTMTYPLRVQDSDRRVIGFDYGDNAGDADSALSRVTHVSDQFLDLAVSYAYAGTGTPVATTAMSDAGNTATVVYAQSFRAGEPVGYAGLDRLGRVTDLHYTREVNGQTETVHRYRYGYDSAGNRLFARVTQSGEDNTRSYLYGYDKLGRLISAEYGALNATNDAIETSLGAPEPARVTWGLDRLGNWALDNGREEWSWGGAAWASEGGKLHGVELDNRLSSITSVPPGGGNPATEPIVSDLNGNLICDNVYWYQYDSFNRLVQVNGVGTLAFGSDGSVLSGTPGPWMMHCVYDGLGRVVAKERPWPGPPQDEVRLIRYLYDGVRRIQEIVRDPIVSTTPVGSVGAGGGGGYTTWTDREYVHSPHYVDELLYQVDRTGAVAWVLQDANYNVVGLLGGSGNVLQQWQYDPYGEPVAFDALGTYANNRAGHQGLFFDRLDGALSDPALVVEGKGIYQADNRAYSARLGRWLQKDPIGTGRQLLHGPTPMSPGSPSVAIASADAALIHADGMSVYHYVGSNPINHTDPSGLIVTIDLMGTAQTRSQLASIQLVRAIGATMFIDGIRQAIAGQQSWLMVAADAAFMVAGGPMARRGMDLLDEAIMGYGRASKSVAQDAVVTANRAFGGTAEDFVHSVFGGEQRRYFATNIGRGGRYVDVYSGGIAREVKTGTISLTSDIEMQVLKDAELLATGRVQRVEWLFFDGRTGNPGRPTKPLEALLRSNGIDIKIMGPLR